MGRLPYNAGPEYIFIDFLGLLDKTVGHILFYDRSRPSRLLTTYYTLATAVISKIDPENSFHVPQDTPESPYIQYLRKANPDVILCLAPMMYPALMELCKSPWFVENYKPKYCLYWVLFFEKNGLATKEFNNPDNLPVMMQNEIYTNFPDQCLVSAYKKATSIKTLSR